MNEATLEAKRRRSRESMRKRRKNPEYREKEKEYDREYRRNNPDKEKARQARFHKRRAERGNI
ncbi:hypothetical protein V7024_15975 [Bacillus sp. JJ864]|uniref:hypothetical protein n=1 Tax=Bacillus sp. JJ864 TaxID=3122975 RepID=UPI002FFE31F4